jgi:hypothetical protein
MIGAGTGEGSGGATPRAARPGGGVVTSRVSIGWARKAPAQGEAQQLGFTVCNPVPCPQSGRQNKTPKRSRKQNY